MKYLKTILLSPFAFIYGAIMTLRNWLYKSHFIGSTHFEIPVIAVGNLSVGGNGKTPFIELLIELFYHQYNIAVLSRGYKRKTSGFMLVHSHHKATEVGDEPLMLKLKYPNVTVSVGEERVVAIPKLLSLQPQTQVILLDDAFQHQSVRPDVNILLTAYDKPFYEDSILPLGSLREFASGKERANIIVVTKCPENLGEQEQTSIIKKIQPKQNQKIFFATQLYFPAYHLFNPEERIDLNNKNNVYALITGIANSTYIKNYVEVHSKSVVHFEFSDHHTFELKELESIAKNYPELKTWITTEKDAVRLGIFKQWFDENGIKLYCLPIKTKLLSKNEQEFSTLLREYLKFYYNKTDIDSESVKNSESDNSIL
ncbi:MAG: tetraacyldisaccharide 4'-kinase [Bacteroidetes bacterium]|nr:tetraacyldisaccharide 4'-kinase [Bacteroidota bacterium]